MTKNNNKRKTLGLDSHELLLLDEVAQICRSNLSTVRHWIRIGSLKSIRPGRRRLVRRKDLESFLGI